jgi:hypothetical protein
MNSYREKPPKLGSSLQKKRQNGRLDFKALQAHYGGKGNESVMIKEAKAASLQE